MRRKSSSWPGLRKWLYPDRFFDTWFFLLERSRSACRGWFDFAIPSRRRPAFRRRSYLPHVEGLELRVLMDSTVYLNHGADSANYNANSLRVVVDLSTSSVDTITVDYATTDGTALAGTDYQGASGTLTFLPGDSQETLWLNLLDHQESSNVTFMLSLSSPTNATLYSPNCETVTIVETPAINTVVDQNANVVLPANGTPINSYSNWSMALAAELSGATGAQYTWNFASAPDTTSVTGTSSYDPTFTWKAFSGSKTDTITLSETASPAGTNSVEQLATQSYLFKPSGTDATAWASSSPTTASTWPNVITPDQLSGQDMVAAGPYAEVGQVDGSVQTAFSLPSYNPDAAPLGLVYNSAVADALPTFLVKYQLSSTSLPTTVNATLTINGTAGSTVYYSPSALNKSDTIIMALQATPTMLSGLTTGRYSWSISITTTPTSSTTPYSGYFDFVNTSTTPTTLSNNPFGPGWSLDDVTRLWPVTITGASGAVIQNPDGTSLWFASSGSGTYTHPAGDFSTLTSSGSGTSLTYTRTMPDGTKFQYNYLGQQTAISDRDGNTTAFNYDTSTGELTTVTDVNGGTASILYNSSGFATSVEDPDTRALTLAYSSGNQLTGVTDPGSNVWTYGYDSSSRLTSIKDPRSTGSNYKTTFAYNSASQVSSVTQPDSSTLLFTAEQLTGLATGGTGTSGNPAKAVLAASAAATYTDPNSKTWTESFDGLGFGLPAETVDPLGNTALTYRDSSGLPWLASDPLGRGTRQFFDGNGNVATVVNAVGAYSTASYNSFAEPTVVKNFNPGSTTPLGTSTYTYNTTTGDLLSMEDSLSHTTSFSWTSSGVKGLLRTVTKPLAAAHSSLYTTTFSRDSTSNLVTAITEALSSTVNISASLSYDTLGDLAAYTDFNGNSTSYNYDNLGHVTTEILPGGASTITYRYYYDPVGNMTSEIVPLTASTNATYTFAYTPMNWLSSTTDPLNNTTTYSRDLAGNLTGITNALGNTTSLALNADGNVSSVTIPLVGSTSATTSYAMNADGETTAVENPDSQTTDYTYCACGCPVGETDPQGNSTSVSYDGIHEKTGFTRSDTHGNSASTALTYNADTGLLASTTDPLTQVTDYTYDANNNLTSITTTDQYVDNVAYTYDPLDRLQSVTDDNHITSGTTTYGRDHMGNVTTVTDPLGNVTTMTYNAQGQVLSKTVPLTSSTSATTQYAYNLAGWLTSVTDPDSNTFTYAYNADGWLTQVTDPHGYTKTYSYDNIGELTELVDYDSRETTYSYNKAGWRTGESWFNGATVVYSATYSYDNNGQLTAATDSKSTYTFTYNSDGEVTQSTVSYPGLPSMGTVTLTYGYDGFGNRTSLTDNAGGTSATTTYAFNKDSQLTSLDFHTGSTNADLTFTYNATTSALTSIVMTGGTDTITAAFSYGSGAESITYADGTQTFASFQYAFNGAGQVTSYYGPAGSSGFTNATLTYAYDKSGQLTSVTGGETYSYSFDNNGNRNATGYTTSTGNEMTNAPSGTYAYDNEGNLTSVTDTSGNAWTYSWDYRNRLTQVVEKNGGTTLLNETLTYDVFNNLIGNGVEERWTVYDGKNPYIDFDNSGNLATRYVSDPTSPDRHYARVSASGTLGWYFTDLTGSVREIVSASGTPLDKVNYDPFGTVLYEYSAASGDRFKFDGGEYDSSLNLYHFGARWLDPTNGRWISQDPIGFAAGDSNLYRYVGDNPISSIDPSGLDSIVTQGNYVYWQTADGQKMIVGELGGPNNSQVYISAFVNPADYGLRIPSVISLAGLQAAASRLDTGRPTGYGRMSLISTAYRLDPQNNIEQNQYQSGQQLPSAQNSTQTVGQGGQQSIRLAGQLVREAGVSAACSIIGLSQARWIHIIRRHIPGGIDSAGRSVFTIPARNLGGLILRAEGVAPVRQAIGQNFERIVDAGRVIGIDRATGLPTQIYTVITNAAGDLITMFPGTP